MQYFHTNEDLANIMTENNRGGVEWEKYGFNLRDISRRQAFCMVNDHMEVLLPITNKSLFDKELGEFITKGTDEEFFYRVLSDDEAQAKKAEFKAIREAQKADNPVR